MKQDESMFNSVEENRSRYWSLIAKTTYYHNNNQHKATLLTACRLYIYWFCLQKQWTSSYCNLAFELMFFRRYHQLISVAHFFSQPIGFYWHLSVPNWRTNRLITKTWSKYFLIAWFIICRFVSFLYLLLLFFFVEIWRKGRFTYKIGDWSRLLPFG